MESSETTKEVPVVNNEATSPVKPPAPRSVAIVAMGTSRNDYITLAVTNHSRHRVVDEIWAVNAMAGVIQWDKAFIIDDYKEMPVQYLDIYKEAGSKPIYTSYTNPAFPCLIEYPVLEVVKILCGLPYLNTSVAYALAYALYLGVKDIWLFGCDFCYPDIYKGESGRGCVEAWMMYGILRGHRIHVAPTSTLFDTSLGMPLYAFQDKFEVVKAANGEASLVKKEKAVDKPNITNKPVEEVSKAQA